jgi:hypothetical protein
MVSEAGTGDYWDFVDRAVRNSLAEAQLADIQRLRAISNGASDAQLKRLLGLFTASELPEEGVAQTAGDSDVNAAMGLYYAWDGIMTYDNETAKVNLPLNRAARWGDVYSYLPHQGSVIYKNKWAKRVMIRIPGFVNSPQSSVVVRLNGAIANFSWSGRYVVVDDLTNGSIVNVSFPVMETTTTFRWNDTSYTALFRGHTVLTLVKNGADGGPTVASSLETYPLYQRGPIERYRTMPGIKTVTRFVNERRFPLQFETFIGTYD